MACGAPTSISSGGRFAVHTSIGTRARSASTTAGCSSTAAAPRWRSLAARAYAEATGATPGPVHLDLAFRAAAHGTPGELPVGRGAEGAWTWRPATAAPADPIISLVDDLAGRRGILVAGAGSGSGAAVAAVAEALGWPVFAAPQADVWGHPVAVPAVDALLRTPVELRPEVIVRLGRPLASSVAAGWLAGSGAAEIVAAGAHSWIDPAGTAAVVLPVTPDALLERWTADLDRVGPVDEGAWASRWHDHGHLAQAAIDAVLDDEPAATEPLVARRLVGALPPSARLVASSSMPIRDLEWYVRPGGPLAVDANRGANGIDGVVSTAVGLALADRDRPTALLIGDVAFLHDSNGLLGAASRDIDLVIVVVDNDGGGIFSFLPPATAVAPDRFERLFGTPHGLDLAALAAAYGVRAAAVDDLEEAVRASLGKGGVHVLVVRTDRATNVEVHQRLNDAVAAAVAREP